LPVAHGVFHGSPTTQAIFAIPVLCALSTNAWSIGCEAVTLLLVWVGWVVFLMLFCVAPFCCVGIVGVAGFVAGSDGLAIFVVLPALFAFNTPCAWSTDGIAQDTIQLFCKRSHAILGVFAGFTGWVNNCLGITATFQAPTLFTIAIFML